MQGTELNTALRVVDGRQGEVKMEGMYRGPSWGLSEQLQLISALWILTETC